jgi:hypothetical protein
VASYFKAECGQQSVATLFTQDEARHIATAVAELPELWRKASHQGRVNS